MDNSLPAPSPSSIPEVSIVIPARNEEVNLGACLESLASQTGVAFEIIVVDDGSTDHTREIARSFSGVQVISAPALPEKLTATSWTGKNNALVAGAKQARAEWLLFTDADTVHFPGSLARALAEAKTQGADLLSYSPEQTVVSFAERAVMPVVFAELALQYPPKKVREPEFRSHRCQWAIHPRAPGSLRHRRRARCRGRGNTGGRSARPALSQCRQARVLPLWRRCRAHPHVPQLDPTSRRLDEEPGALVSSIQLAGI